jgi:hypothetical protein
MFFNFERAGMKKGQRMTKWVLLHGVVHAMG